MTIQGNKSSIFSAGLEPNPHDSWLSSDAGKDGRWILFGVRPVRNPYLPASNLTSATHLCVTILYAMLWYFVAEPTNMCNNTAVLYCAHSMPLLLQARGPWSTDSWSKARLISSMGLLKVHADMPYVVQPSELTPPDRGPHQSQASANPTTHKT